MGLFTDVQLRRVAQLEQKVDSLVTLLTSTQKELANGNTFTPGGDDRVTRSMSPTQQIHSAVLDEIALRPKGSALSGSSGHSVGSQSRTHGEKLAVHEQDSINYPEELYCSYEEAESLLVRFQTQLTRNLPFFVIPQNTTVEALFRQRPFLLKTIIMAVSYDNLSRRSKLRSAVTETLCQQLLFQGARSLDLLQGILILVAW